MKDYILTVGLEIHVELATETKMFCNSKNDTDEWHPNTNVFPVCLGYPGTLPTINKEAVRSVLRLGVALGGQIADYTEFNRKNYFYPDIPKGYQISQYKYPLVQGGMLNDVAITRVHLEEDTAKSLHNESGHSLLDFNRAGIPLMELVTEPVIKTPADAANFAREWQLLLRYLDISGANMEKGEMRVEANVSVQRSDLKKDSGGSTLGTKVEIKNLNSFKVVEKAIKFEMARQINALEKGEKVVQETRGWDENKEETFSQRIKESAHDYRYFPDPDLPKLSIKDIPEFSEMALRASLPELPRQKRERLSKLGISKEHMEIYVAQPEWGKLFEEVVDILKDKDLIKLVSNYITSELKSLVSPVEFSEVIRMVTRGELSSKGAKGVLKVLAETGGETRKIAEEENLMQENNREILEKIVEEVLEENKNAPVQFLVGQAMKKSGNRANPVILQELLKGRKGDRG